MRNADAQSLEQEGRGVMKKRILVVDDDWAILELLKFRLSHRGFEVVTAENEQEFWDQALGKKPHLIILDIWLQDKIGTQVYQRLLEAGLDQEIPVIFITALIEEQQQTRASHGGRYALYSKPFDFEALMKEIQGLLSG